MDPFAVPNPSETAVQLQEGELHDVVDIGRVRDPPPDERAQAGVELGPSGLGDGARRLFTAGPHGC